jgi:hypothetical protein
MTEGDKQVYEEYESLRCKGVQIAEKRYRKLCKGQIAFSPQLQSVSYLIMHGHFCKKRRNKCNTF